MHDLYERHWHMVRGLCQLLLRETAEAEDAAQQSFLSAYRALLSGTEPNEPAAWIATIARNECRTRIRRRMRVPLPVADEPNDLPDPLDEAIRRFDLAAVWSAVRELPARQRKAFLLREVGGLSYDELAVALGVTGPAVESLLVRARARLRDALASVGSFVPALERLASWSFPSKVATATVGLGLVAGGTIALPRGEGGPAKPEVQPVTHVVHARVRRVAVRQQPAPVAVAVRAVVSRSSSVTGTFRVEHSHERERGDRTAEHLRQQPPRSEPERGAEPPSSKSGSGTRDSTVQLEPTVQSEGGGDPVQATSSSDGGGSDSHDSGSGSGDTSGEGGGTGD